MKKSKKLEKGSKTGGKLIRGLKTITKRLIPE